MANAEHLALLRAGASGWNAWRAGRDATPDLSRASLRGVDLSGFDLSQTDLRGADLRGANLSGTNLSAAHLGGCQPFQSGTRWRRSRRSLSLWCTIPELRPTGRHPELAVGIPRRSARLWRFNPEVSTCPFYAIKGVPCSDSKAERGKPKADNRIPALRFRRSQAL